MLKDRIAHIMRSKNLTAAQFADQLEVQRSGISHLLSGRNKPSLDFVLKLKETFPEYSLDWIILGKGPVTVSSSHSDKDQSLFDFDPSQTKVQTEEEVSAHVDFKTTGNQLSTNKKSSPELEEDLENNLQKEIVRIILIYSDNTFEQLDPLQKR